MQCKDIIKCLLVSTYYAVLRTFCAMVSTLCITQHVLNFLTGRCGQVNSPELKKINSYQSLGSGYSMNINYPPTCLPKLSVDI